MIAHIINLLQCNIHVGIVTAAGYPGEAQKVCVGTHVRV